MVPVESSCPEVELGMDWVDSLGVVSTDCPAQSVQGSRNSKNAFDLIRSNSSDLNVGYTAEKQSIQEIFPGSDGAKWLAPNCGHPFAYPNSTGLSVSVRVPPRPQLAHYEQGSCLKLHRMA